MRGSLPGVGGPTALPPRPEAFPLDPRRTARLLVDLHGRGALTQALVHLAERNAAEDLAGVFHYEQAFQKAARLLKREAYCGPDR